MPASDARDRDDTGRARNNRPRDGLGRPLPRDATGVERVPDGLTLPPAESLVEAQRLLDDAPGFVFSAGGPVSVVQDMGYLAWAFGPAGQEPVVRGADVAVVPPARWATAARDSGCTFSRWTRSPPSAPSTRCSGWPRPSSSSR